MKRCVELSTQLQQRINIHFCVKLGWKFGQIKDGLRQCYGRVLSDSTIRFWMSEFKKGRTRLVDKPRKPKERTGRSVQNVRKVEDLVAEDRRVTIKEMSLRSGISTMTIQRILKFDLKLKKRCAIFVPVDLTPQQKQRRVDVCNFWTRLKGTTPRVFKHVVTMDESWVYIYDPALRIHSKEWLRATEPRPQKPRRTIATAKGMIVTFFDCRRMIYFEYLQRPVTMNQQVFRAIFRRFDAAFTRRCPNSLVHGHKFLHMDNAPPHTAVLTLGLIDQLGWTRLPHPAYSPDLAPNDFWFYSRLKKDIRGVKFPSTAALKEAVSDQIADIPSQDYQRAILSSWPQRWRWCLEEQGSYFEGH